MLTEHLDLAAACEYVSIHMFLSSVEEVNVPFWHVALWKIMMHECLTWCLVLKSQDCQQLENKGTQVLVLNQYSSRECSVGKLHLKSQCC